MFLNGSSCADIVICPKAESEVFGLLWELQHIVEQLVVLAELSRLARPNTLGGT